MLECPFCGSSALPLHDGRTWTVNCNNDGTWGTGIVPCGAIGPERATIEEAADAWNTRASATEARRAMTPKSGMVHDGAARDSGDAQPEAPK